MSSALSGVPAVPVLSRPQLARLRRAVILPFLLGLTWALSLAKDWEAVNPADLAAKESTTSPGADLEILSSKHVLDGSGDSDWIDNRVRAKVYTVKGVDQLSVLKIEYDKESRTRWIAARLVKPDGTAVELKKSDFHETTVYKWGGGEWKRISFAFPNVTPGDVLEYRWSQSISTESFSHYSIFCQEAIPVREFSFDVQGSTKDSQVMWFNTPKAEFKKMGSSQMRLRIQNIPAFEEEKWMPPERDFRGWVLVVFSHPYLRSFSNDEVWREIGSYVAEEFRLGTKPSGAVKAKAAELVDGAKTPEEKLFRLYDFCQKEISNNVWLTSAEIIKSREARDKEDVNQSPQTTMKRLTGRPEDINWLFAGLARAAGFEVRLALSADRHELGNIRTPKGWMFLNRHTVAVHVGDVWEYYSPGEYCVPAGMLSTKDEAVTAFVCDEDKCWYETTPNASAGRTLVKRKGRFTLDLEGTLDGEVELQLGGHAGIEQKEKWWGKEESEATKDFREQLTAHLPTAEISDITWENLKNRQLPVIVRYKVHAPGYAEVAGSRLVVTPNFFEAGVAPVFTADKRQYPIYFDYAEKDQDDIELVFPEGYTLDGGSSPANVGDPAGLIAARYGLRLFPKTRTLSYQRERVVGNGAIAFRAESYPQIKKLFEDINRSDRHSLVLKPKATTAQAAPAPTSAADAK